MSADKDELAEARAEAAALRAALARLEKAGRNAVYRVDRAWYRAANNPQANLRKAYELRDDALGELEASEEQADTALATDAGRKALDAVRLAAAALSGPLPEDTPPSVRARVETARDALRAAFPGVAS